ncbi:MAG TPA: FAD-dependent monooxygenase [Pseudonocardia sp.]|jgi:2-polyprenyl-6-methoxyphenol hydroxylase-like FAD-dependent oxidoreductase
MNIVCVGAGPAGLYFAICTKLRNPEHSITIIERSPEGVTFGWGFGFWDDVLDSLYRNDPVSAKQIEAASGVWDGIEVHISDKPTAFLGGYGLSMGRQRLLDILVARARELGIELHFEREVTDLSEFADADLIVASDGINSGLRERDASTFGTSVELGRNYYLWLGTSKVFNAFQYIFEKTPAGWIWLHCYYLDEGRSTCIVECPPETWNGLGLDKLGPEEYLKELETIFVRHLDGHALISQLHQVNTVTGLHGKQVANATWYHDNVALVGDAAHSTHFSIGSGTRLAIGDSVALADKVAEHGTDVAAALRAYDADRRPVIDNVQRQALNSMRWLEGAPSRLDAPDMDPVQFAYAVSKRLGSRGAKWRYYLHLATQVRALRAVRGKLTAARRARRVQQRAKFNDLAGRSS